MRIVDVCCTYLIHIEDHSREIASYENHHHHHQYCSNFLVTLLPTAGNYKHPHFTKMKDVFFVFVRVSNFVSL